MTKRQEMWEATPVADAAEVSSRDGNPGQPHSRSLRAGRLSERLGCYAIRKTVAGREPLLARKELTEIVLGSLNHLRTSGRIKLIAFCVMPEHCHVLMFLTCDDSLSDVMRSFAKYTAGKINRMLGRQGRFWQEGFYDHRCRDEEDIERAMSYIEHNPVRAELVEKAEDWPFSSAHASRRNVLDRDWYVRVK